MSNETTTLDKVLAGVEAVAEGQKGLKGVIEAVQKTQEDLSGRVEVLEKKTEEADTRLQDVESVHRKKLPNIPDIEGQTGPDKFKFSRLFYGMITNDWSDSGYEREVHEECFRQAKQLNTGVGTSGGFLVPTQLVAELIPYLRAKTAVIQAGATVLDGLTASPVTFPKQTAGASISWGSETGAATDKTSSTTFGLLEMTPKTAKMYTSVSNRLIRASAVAAEQVVRRDLTAAIATGTDVACLEGSGVNGQPLGIANVNSVQTTAYSATDLGTKAVSLYTGIALVESANAPMLRPGYVMHPSAYATFITTADTNKRPYALPEPYPYKMPGDIASGPSNAKNLFGYPCFTTTGVTVTAATPDTSTAYAGDWSELILGYWTMMEFKTTDVGDTPFKNDLTWIRVVQEVDCGVRHAESFCTITGVTHLT